MPNAKRQTLSGSIVDVSLKQPRYSFGYCNRDEISRACSAALANSIWRNLDACSSFLTLRLANGVLRFARFYV